LCSMSFQEVAHLISYISPTTYSLIWKQRTWIFGPRRQGQFFACTWIITCVITDRTLRQKSRRTTFPESRTCPIHEMEGSATFGPLGC
jgi:hypothetical protein